mmetsp:Transcript_27413/g.64029  ORF Transcript_27413/g.64029 Transcript_27413/m.64029 type:complete len:825 (+) Transcript_27413:71-2545(+)
MDFTSVATSLVNTLVQEHEKIVQNKTSTLQQELRELQAQLLVQGNGCAEGTPAPPLNLPCALPVDEADGPSEAEVLKESSVSNAERSPAAVSDKPMQSCRPILWDSPIAAGDDPDKPAAALASYVRSDTRRTSVNSVVSHHEAPAKINATAVLLPLEVHRDVGDAHSELTSEPLNPHNNGNASGDSSRHQSVEVHAAWMMMRQQRKAPRTGGRRKSLGSLDKALSTLPTTPRSVGSWMESVDSDGNDELGPCKRCRTSMWSFMHRLVSPPGSARRLGWDVLGMVFMIYDLIVIPLETFGPRQNVATDVLGWTTTVYWTVDIPMSVFAGFYAGTGIVEMRIRKIAAHYARTWFVFDLFVVVVDWAISVAEALERSFSLTSGSASYLRVGRFLRFMRVLRLLRLLKMQAIISELLDRISSETSLIMIGIVKLIIFIMLLNHVIACLWYGLGDLNKVQSWIIQNDIRGDTLGYRYFTALHWSLTQFTPASMEVVPENTAERCFAVSVLLFAMVTFSSFVSSITNAMTRLRNLNSERADRHQKLRQYLCENKVSTELMARIWSCMNQIMKSSKSRLHQKDVAYLLLLPRSLYGDLLEEVYAPFVLRHPLFLRFAQEDSHRVRALFNSAFAEMSLSDGHELFSPAVEVQEVMYFMLSGTALYRPEEVEAPVGVQATESKQTIKLIAPEWMCEAALWLQWVHVGTLTANSHCELISMKATKAQDVLGGLEPIRSYVTQFAQYCNEHRDDVTDVWNSQDLQAHWVSNAFSSERDCKEMEEHAANNGNKVQGTSGKSLFKSMSRGSSQGSFGGHSKSRGLQKFLRSAGSKGT